MPISPSPSNLDKLKKLRTAMKDENSSGRGWLKCMIQISRFGKVGADFEYNDPDRWKRTIDNYKERIKEFSKIPV